MNTRKRQTLMEQLGKLPDGTTTPENRTHLSEAFNQLLKAVYSRIRGQVSPSILRGLLDIEIEIGGEDADFNGFSNHRMILLFERGALGDRAAGLLPGEHSLSTAVDLSAIGRWIDGGGEGEHLSPERDAHSASFVRAWMRLFAMETGVVVSGVEALKNDPQKAGMSLLPKVRIAQPGEPFVEPVTGMTMVPVSGGTFSMGDTFSEGVEDEKPVHEVTLSDFYMAVAPVTQAQWRCLMADNPSQFVADDHPVEQVSLADVMAFIDKLNAGSPAGLHFDLPSEAQWEYAARSGGKSERFAGGPELDAVGWYADNNPGGTAAVTTKQSNGLGLYDMSGNVWEWCRDHYHEDAYRRHTATDPVYGDGGPDRVIRGGSWHLDAWSARCARRFRFDPELFGPALGFRIVCWLE